MTSGYKMVTLPNQWLEKYGWGFSNRWLSYCVIKAHSPLRRSLSHGLVCRFWKFFINLSWENVMEIMLWIKLTYNDNDPMRLNTRVQLWYQQWQTFSALTCLVLVFCLGIGSWGPHFELLMWLIYGFDNAACLITMRVFDEEPPLWHY